MDLWKKDPILSAIELRDLVLLRQKIEIHQVSMGVLKAPTIH